MKKVLSLVLAVVMVLGMTSVAFAAYTAGGVDIVPSQSSYDAIPAGTQIKLYLVDSSAVLGASGTYPASAYLTRAEVRDSKITFQIKKTSGGSALSASEIKYESTTAGTSPAPGAAYIRLSMIDPYVATKEMDFDYAVYLLYNKTKDAASEIPVGGTLENPKQYVNEDDDYVYVKDQPVVQANDYVKKIEVDLGDGVSISARMFQDKKYYGYVTQEIKTADIDITDKYADIDTVYYLSTIGLNNSGNIVKFDLDSNMYVYVQNDAGDLVYLGRSNTLLPYYTKYFVASKELDIQATASVEPDDVIPEPDDITGGTDNAITGGDDVIANANDNPGTGC